MDEHFSSEICCAADAWCHLDGNVPTFPRTRVWDPYKRLGLSPLTLQRKRYGPHKSKINLKTRLKKKVEESPLWLKALLDFVEMPQMDSVLRRLFLFAFMGEGGPAFQVALSLAACIYFLNEKTKSLGRACLIGIGALTAGWFCGSLIIPMIPTVFINPTWTLELLTSLVAYAFLFVSCTFLK
ncbi:BnaA02g33020D [Brassica napus]|uniref:BnaA02g33020D protein n=1 Tax=Brassica napus TaxID=3708 RepID=A0A078IC64_BRANA|nr:BnaA02g33020D [Brassica napus]